MKKKLVYGILAGLLVMSFTSCVSTATSGLSQSKVKKALKEGNWGTPENSALLFTPNSAYNDFLQQNPKFGYKFYKTTTRTEAATVLIFTFVTGSVAFVEPLPVGSELKLFSSTTGSGNSSTTTYFGIAGVDVVLNKPGLFYYNPYDKEGANELKSLKVLYKYFKGSDSAWEHVIADRIEELKNAKK